jgi:RND family efflux transporter MFP subunit
MTNKVFASGTVRAVSRQVVQATDLRAPIKQINVQVGQSVYKGQVLITERNDAEYAALIAAENAEASARASLNDAQRQYNAAPPGFRLEFATALTNATQAYASAKTQLAQAEAAYQATLIRSQIDGVVLLENPDGFAPDGTAAPIMEVVSQQKHIVLFLSEVDAVRLSPGMKVDISTEAFPNRTWQGTVERIAPYAVNSDTGPSGSTGPGQVEVDVSVPSGFVVPYGYQVDVRIISSTHVGVPSIPYEALVQRGDNYAVFVYRNGRVHLVNVTVGITGDTRVEITKGLKVGDKVVTNPPSDLTDGEAVNVQ